MNWKGYKTKLSWPLTQYYPRSCWSDCSEIWKRA